MTAPLLTPGMTVVSTAAIALATCEDGCGALHTTQDVPTWQAEDDAVNVARDHASSTGHHTKVDIEFALDFFPHVEHVTMADAR